MKILSHSDPKHKEQLKVLDNDAPFQFLEGFTLFYREFYKQEVFILYSEEFDAYMPIRFYNSRNFTMGQILHAPIHNNEELVPKDQLIFFNMMMRFIRKSKLCVRLVQPHPYGILSALPPNVQWCEFGTYVIDLSTQTKEEIFSKFHLKYQKAIMHSKKNGAVVRISWDVFEDFYTVYSATMKRVDMDAEVRSFFTVMRECMGDGNVVPGVVYDHDFPIGCVFFIYTRYAGFCTHAGSQGESKLYGSMKFLHNEMIDYLKARNVRRYDLVGVRLKNNDPSLEGIFRFKKGFGGDLKTGYLWKADINKRKSRIYEMLLTIKHHRNKPKDIIDQVST